MLIGENDDLVDHEEFKAMFNQLGSQRKILRYMENIDHGDFRPLKDLEYIKEIILEVLSQDKMNKELNPV
jgi:hypothetical protein